MNVTFIGMSGAGKSYFGKAYAEKFGLDFVDVDKIIESKFSKPLQNILDELGDDMFVATEAKIIRELVIDKPAVIAPGGSVIYHELAMKHLRSISVVVYLKVPAEEIESRVTTSGRGIVGFKDHTFTELYNEREVLYTKYADLVVEPKGKDLEAVLLEIEVGVKSLRA